MTQLRADDLVRTNHSPSLLTAHLVRQWPWIFVGLNVRLTSGPTNLPLMLPSGAMLVRNEQCLPIPASIFSLCPNQKHIYKHSFALPSVYVNPIHFGQSICSVYTHRLQRGTKGPFMTTGWGKPPADEWPCTQHSFRGLGLLAELRHRALPAGENRSVKKWKIHWFDAMGFSTSLLTCYKGSLCLHVGQLERSTLQKTLW